MCDAAVDADVGGETVSRWPAWGECDSACLGYCSGLGYRRTYCASPLEVWVVCTRRTLRFNNLRYRRRLKRGYIVRTCLGGRLRRMSVSFRSCLYSFRASCIDRIWVRLIIRRCWAIWLCCNIVTWVLVFVVSRCYRT